MDRVDRACYRFRQLPSLHKSLSILAMGLLACAQEPRPAPPVPAPAPPATLPTTTLTRQSTSVRVRFGDTLESAAEKAGATRDEGRRLYGAMRAGCGLKLMAGDFLRLTREDGAIAFAEVRQGPADACEALRERLDFRAARRTAQVETTTVRFEATITSSLYEALDAAGEDPALAVTLADVLAWDVDFYRDPRRGDRISALVDKRTARGRTLGYGEVFAASYQGEVAQAKIFRWSSPDGKLGYYDEYGKSAQKAFLRTPLRYARLTSHFGMRRHPILHQMRAHHGVDYGAPTGTPVWAVADGYVEQAGWNGGLGKSVTLRHANGLTTIYGHLSRLDVRGGQRVAQKQILGAVGSTGLSTAPHLHYAMKRGGGYMNPLSLKLPPAAPVPAAQLAMFLSDIAPLVQALSAQAVALTP